jgi:hypothetical protein
MWVKRHARADINDQPITRCQHVWQHSARHVDGAHDIDVEHAHPFRRFQFQKWCESTDARAIDESAGASKFAADLLPCTSHGRLVSNVAREASRLRGALLTTCDDLIERVRIDVNQSQGMPFGR